MNTPNNNATNNNHYDTINRISSTSIPMPCFSHGSKVWYGCTEGTITGIYCNNMFSLVICFYTIAMEDNQVHIDISEEFLTRDWYNKTTHSDTPNLFTYSPSEELGITLPTTPGDHNYTPPNPFTTSTTQNPDNDPTNTPWDGYPYVPDQQTSALK
eukprot:1579762-Ditylum_brightwellii.AAC.1